MLRSLSVSAVAVLLLFAGCGDSSDGASDDESGGRAGSGGGGGTGGSTGGSSAGTGEAGADSSGGTGGSETGGTGGGGSAGKAGASASGGSGGSGGASGGSTGGASGSGAMAGSGGGAGAAGNCEPPEILLLLDRSASMQDPPDVFTPPETRSKWVLTAGPLADALMATSPDIALGFKVFPEDSGENACLAASVTGAVLVTPADDNADVVATGILAQIPDGPGTPTGDAVFRSKEFLAARTSSRPKFILLVTDGAPSCSYVTETMDGVEGAEDARGYAIDAIAQAYAAGIPTYVVGIATSSELAVEAMNAMAVAGGRLRPDVNPTSPLFYQVDAEGELASAIAAVASAASSCTVPPGGFPLPFFDDFEDGDANGWAPYSDWGELGDWAVVDDGGNFVYEQRVALDDVVWSVGGDRNWTDVRVEAHVKFVSETLTDEGLLYLGARFGPNDHYYAEYRTDGRLRVRKHAQGTTEDMINTDAPTPAGLGTWHDLALTLNAGAITLELDGAVLGTMADAMPLATGGIALGLSEAVVAFDDVRVTAP